MNTVSMTMKKTATAISDPEVSEFKSSCGVSRNSSAFAFAFADISLAAEVSVSNGNGSAKV
jgi:hypothetical protein